MWRRGELRRARRHDAAGIPAVRHHCTSEHILEDADDRGVTTQGHEFRERQDALLERQPALVIRAESYAGLCNRLPAGRIVGDPTRAAAVLQYFSTQRENLIGSNEPAEKQVPLVLGVATHGGGV